MKLITRRIILGVGAALLVGGWASTQYAQHRAKPYPVSADLEILQGAMDAMKKSNTTFRSGVLAMALGAGLIGFGVLRGESKEGEQP